MTMPVASALRRRSAVPVAGGELALIERIRLRAAANQQSSKALRLGIGDDCAILTPAAGHDLLVTTDFSLESRHFRRDWHSAASAGHRTLARGLSDLAAMGAQPLAAFLSLALPRKLARNTAWLDGYVDGLLALAAESKVPLAGGDTSESPSEHVLADIVLLGTAPRGRALRRSGARAGDLLYCTGALGGAAAELSAVAAAPRRFRSVRAVCDHPHLFPQPRLAVGQALLRRRLATACMDLSDGLSTDLNHLCVASGVAAEIDVSLLPLHPLAAELEDAAQVTAALHGGEDYELLFTAGSAATVPRSIAGVPVTRIGRIVKQRKGAPRMTIQSDGVSFELQPRGWEHLV